MPVAKFRLVSGFRKCERQIGKRRQILKVRTRQQICWASRSRAVFDIGGNNYRMIFKYAFGERSVSYMCVGSIHTLNMINCVTATTSILYLIIECFMTMGALKYKVIKTEKQYDEYCRVLQDLDFSGKRKIKRVEDEIELLTVLIEKYDKEHNTFENLDPVQLLSSFIKDHDLKAKDLVEILGISKGYVSDILNYKKGFSKAVIRRLAEYFKVSQEAFNRPYQLSVLKNSRLRKARVLKKKKRLPVA